MYMKLLLGAFVLGISLRLGQSCSCNPSPNANYSTILNNFCDANIVAKFGVRSNLRIVGGAKNANGFNDEGFYRVRMKGDPWMLHRDLEGIDMKRLYTSAIGSLCGVSLQKGKKYLISGSITDGKINLSLCKSIVQMFPLDENVNSLQLEHGC